MRELSELRRPLKNKTRAAIIVSRVLETDCRIREASGALYQGALILGLSSTYETPQKRRTSSGRYVPAPRRRLTHFGVGYEEDRRERLQVCQVPHTNLVADKVDTREDVGDWGDSVPTHAHSTMRN